MFAKFDWLDVLLFLSAFVPALTKALQAAVAGGVKLDVVTLLMIAVPIIFTSLAVLKNPGSLNAAKLALAAKKAPLPVSPGANDVAAPAAPTK